MEKKEDVRKDAFVKETCMENYEEENIRVYINKEVEVFFNLST